jgi:hypothetical protein
MSLKGSAISRFHISLAKDPYIASIIWQGFKSFYCIIRSDENQAPLFKDRGAHPHTAPNPQIIKNI